MMFHNRFIFAFMVALMCDAAYATDVDKITINNNHGSLTLCCCRNKRAYDCDHPTCDTSPTFEMYAAQTIGTVHHNNTQYQYPYIACTLDGLFSITEKHLCTHPDGWLDNINIDNAIGYIDNHHYYIHLQMETNGALTPTERITKKDLCLNLKCKDGYIMHNKLCHDPDNTTMCASPNRRFFCHYEYSRTPTNPADVCRPGYDCIIDMDTTTQKYVLDCGNPCNNVEYKRSAIDICSWDHDNCNPFEDQYCKADIYKDVASPELIDIFASIAPNSSICLHTSCVDGTSFDTTTSKCVKNDINSDSADFATSTDNDLKYLYARAKELCKNGQWYAATKSCICAHEKNLVSYGIDCGCKQGYYAPDVSSGCIKIPEDLLQQKCASESDAHYYASTNQCLCNKEGYYFDIGTAACIPYDTYNQCKTLEIRGETIWQENECVCLDGRKTFLLNQCIETEENRKERDARNAHTDKIDEETNRANRDKQHADAILNKYNEFSTPIKDNYTTLEQMRKDFDTSVWKDKDGKFNVARVISDSVAGVALGATGGVVVNNVMRKNQVEDGFEELKCKIGTRAVATYGETFKAE